MRSQLGELTDKGRETTYELGRRLRHLYVDRLRFMPQLIANADLIYLRATAVPRALESVQQAFWGMYPLTSRTATFPAPTIVTRTFQDETLFPNDSNCRRFAQLSRAFAQRTADRWNDSEEMAHVSKMVGKWMPDEADNKVAVNSHPRLSGLMDTINSTLAHGRETRLPKEFYDEKARAIIDKIAVEEWFSGFYENLEYRTLGIGGLVGDIVERMTSKIEGAGLSINEIGGENGRPGIGRGGEKGVRFAMSGCHDTTLAGLLTSLGAFDGEKWPPYSSHVAIELFRKKDPNSISSGSSSDATFLSETRPASTEPKADYRPGAIASLLGLRSASNSDPASQSSTTNTAISSVQTPKFKDLIARNSHKALSDSQKDRLEPYYVRIRYNDKVMKIPACAKPGNHYEGDDSLCTFETFKRVADSYVPRNWKAQCASNLNQKIASLDGPSEPAGQIDEGF